MQQDCEVYVDPEEDEVFFGCISEKEIGLCPELVQRAGSPSRTKDDCKLNLSNINSDRESNAEDVKKTVDVIESNNGSNNKNFQKTVSNEDPEASCTELSSTFNNINEVNKIYSNNASVELEHNYSTPMKHKIDKTILSTPKSIVKADRDGGFLKVLSEIALVKAEADANYESKKEDEDKENKIIPEIKVTEPTPEKVGVVSPPKNVSKHLRRFKIIYSSPKNEENVKNSKSESFESCQNSRNRYMDYENGKGSIYSCDKRCSTDLCNESVDLIDLSEPVVCNEKDENVTKKQTEDKQDLVLVEEKENLAVRQTVNEKQESLTEDLVEEKRSHDDTGSLVEQNNDERYEGVAVERENLEEAMLDASRQKEEKPKNCLKRENAVTTRETKETVAKYRFSEEARMIVEVLKKSTVSDTLNMTIQELDAENVENSFLSPEPVSSFDDTVVLTKDVELPKMFVQPSPVLVKVPEKQPRTVEKERHKMTPVLSKSKIQPVKYFSDRKMVYSRNEGDGVKKCVKKLPMEEKRVAAVEEKSKSYNMTEKELALTSKIPVLGLKTLKIPLRERLPHTLSTRSTPMRTPTGKSYKNPKFKNIESPINAYINNKPTSLVLNVKPNLKKDSANKVWKTQTAITGKKIEEKMLRPKSDVATSRLPFVEYRSATPYIFEKRCESRLPRLAPNVQKLIGSHSPRVLKHEGRFYMKTPRKLSDDGTVFEDTNEVSVVVSQAAQKSNTKYL